jgi:hypothetical protein
VQGLLHTQLVDGRPTAAIDIVLSLLLDITQGLAYLHAKNILHGDLKPEVRCVWRKCEDVRYRTGSSSAVRQWVPAVITALYNCACYHAVLMVSCTAERVAQV